MTTTHTLTYAAALRRAEYLSAQGAWHPLHPDPSSLNPHPYPPQDQPTHGDGLTVRPGRCYRAPSRRISPAPPFPAASPAVWLPSVLALELGLNAMCDGVGYIYISAATSTAVYIQPDAHLVTGRVTYTTGDAAIAAAAALRRADLITPAEQVIAAGGRGPDTLARVISDIRRAAPEWIKAMRPPPEGQLHPARDLLWILDAALAVCLGLPLPKEAL